MKHLFDNNGATMSTLAWVSSNLITRGASSALFVYLGACLLTSGGWIINGMMFQPPPSGYSWEDPEVIRIQTGKLTLAAIWLPNPNAIKTILYFHGNAEDIENTRAVLVRLRDVGFSVLAVDYPGYGMSEGTPSERSVYASADAALNFLIHDQKIALPNIVALGVSIGSGPACYLAHKNAGLGGLILQSAFASAFRTVTRIRIFPTDPFPNLKRIRTIPCPKLFIHGTSDATISYRHSEKLYTQAAEPRTLLPIPGADHNDLINHVGLESYARLIYKFATGQALTRTPKP